MLAMSVESFQGGCLCGAVRFTARTPTLFCVHCHCEWCRRAHGAAFVTWIGVPDDRFELTAAETLKWYASSEQSKRAFCTECGTTIFFRSTAAPGEIHIARACVPGPIDREPRAHIFFDAHVPWLNVADELPKHDRRHRGVAAFAAIPERPTQ
jgi:hypothetical protein